MAEGDMIIAVLIAVFLIGLVVGFVACVFVHAPLVLRVEEATTMIENGRNQLNKIRKDIDLLQERIHLLDTPLDPSRHITFSFYSDGLSHERNRKGRRDVPDHRNPLSA
jgi:hypothetical protein